MNGVDRSLTIGIDIGGTKIAAGVVDARGRVIASVRRATPADDPARTQEALAAVVAELCDKYEVDGVGIGAAGFVDAARRTVLFAPNLAWRGEDLKAALRRRTGLPIVVENDANAAAWAEFRFGAGRGEDQMVAVTVGTGIGGGLILDGRLFRGRFGVAAEFGHANVVVDGRPCGCGLRGCWEQYASGRALVRHARALARTSPASAPRLLELAGGRAEDIGGDMVTQAAEEGDNAALRSFAEIGTWLGRGLAGLAAALDPGVFVLGGGVSSARELLRAPAEEAFHRYLSGHGHRPAAEIRIAELGFEAGVVGAADLARR